MKVAHIIDSGGYYGAEVMLVHLCQAQQALGVDVEVISIGTPGDYEKPLEKKLRECGIPYKIWRMKPLPDLREAHKIMKYCEEGSANLIHSHGYKGNILFGLLPRRLRPLPVITTMHGYTKQKGISKLAVNQWLDKICLRRLDAVVIVSEGMRHQIPRLKAAIGPHVIANGIPESPLRNPDTPPNGFSECGFTIASIGRLSHEKNFQLIIRCMPLVLKKRPDAKLFIFGEGSERPSLEALIKELNLDQVVQLPGYIEDPSQIYRHADVFVNSSLTEGMPMTLLEAMREGCPIVATNIPASKHLLSTLVQGSKLVGFTAEEMAAAIIAVNNLSASELSTVKAEAQEQFTQNYTATKMAQRYLSLYETCLRGFASKR